MKTNKIFYTFTKFVVDFMMYAGIVITVTLPLYLPRLLRFIGYRTSLYTPFVVVLLPSGGLAVYILFQLSRIFKTLVLGDPFVKANVDCLGKCGFAAMIISLIFLIKMVVMPTINTGIISFTFALLGIFALTLKDVFKCAVEYKEETDFTI